MKLDQTCPEFSAPLNMYTGVIDNARKHETANANKAWSISVVRVCIAR